MRPNGNTHTVSATSNALAQTIGISTSGSSPNVLAGIAQAKQIGMKTAALTGPTRQELRNLVDLSICVPSKDTARIQEAHITIGHIICELVEQAFLEK